MANANEPKVQLGEQTRRRVKRGDGNMGEEDMHDDSATNLQKHNHWHPETHSFIAGIHVLPGGFLGWIPMVQAIRPS